MKPLAIIMMIIINYSLLPSQGTNQNSESERLHVLFEEDWNWQMEQYPEWATVLGFNDYNDKLTDLSFEAIEYRKRHDLEMLDKIRKFDRSLLSDQELVSYDLFLRNKEEAAAGHEFPEEYFIIDQLDGPHLNFMQIPNFMPFNNVNDYKDYISRLNAFPKFIEQIIHLLQKGITEKWVQPAVPLRTVSSQIEDLMVQDVTQSPLYKPFAKFPNLIAPEEQSQIRREGSNALSAMVMPAFGRFLKFMNEIYLLSCREEISVSSIPNGEEYYNYRIKRSTTTLLTAREIHDIGLREVERIREEMQKILEEAEFKGNFGEFLQFLRTNPRFYYQNPEDLITGYRDICKRADAELPKLFKELPRNTYGIRAFPDYEAPSQTTARYYPGAADGSRAGYFMVNTYKLDSRPKYEMEALSLHEAVPGHHLQISRAQELGNLPQFRRNTYYQAYIEGWGLYAESLGEQMGFYRDPYSKFGQLTYEMWRACRLVVDTGIHAFGWSREKAINYMMENTGKTENDIIVEVDRYIVWPGQALAYKIGELKIKELRALAKKKLKDSFDMRAFHNAILDDGSLPLDILERNINMWIIAQKQITDL
jgi:uncharacterized protein (DUF885 family)